MTSFDDIVIAVMGSTGAGKSSLIRLLSGDTSVGVGDSLESETADIQVVHFRDPASRRKVLLVDTPGFDDSRQGITDTAVLKMIGAFLVKEYNENRKLNGIIYVQTIAHPRFSGQSTRNLRMFKNLCGTESYKNVVVLTTFWDLVSKELGQKREAQLKSQFFQDLVNGGACFMRHNRTVEQAHEVLKYIFTLDPTYVKLADELGRQKMPFEETAAGSVQREEVERTIAEHRKEVEQLQAEMRAVKDDNEAIKRELEVERAEMQKKLVKWETELEELRGGLDEEREAREQQEENSEWKAVHWPVGSTNWKTTDDTSRLLISRYRLYANNGFIWDYKLEFTNTGGSDFDFMDETGDVYNVFAILDGDHYVRYNSEMPTIVAVRVNVSVASKTR